MKKRLLAGVAFAGLLAGPTMAADIPPPLYKPLPISSWTGFYIGVNLGYSFARNQSNESLFVAPSSGGTGMAQSFTLAPEGWLGGAQVGFNWQAPGSNWVMGIEADWQWAGQKDSVCLDGCSAAFLRIEQKLDWFGTARGRLGYATGAWLGYVTAGAAWGRISEKNAFLDVPGLFTGAANILSTGAASFSDSKVGWTAGGGIEYRLWNGWSAKAEVLYVDLGSVTHTFIVSSPGSGGVGFGTETVTKPMRDYIFRTGLNSKFDWGGPAAANAVVKAPVYKAPPPVMASWSGPYVGANLGYGWDKTTASFAGDDFIGSFFVNPGFLSGTNRTLGPLSFNSRGVVGGVQAGYNWQVTPFWLVGFEADFQGASVKGDGLTSNLIIPSAATLVVQEVTMHRNIDWYGTVRGRLGGLVTPSLLIYGTGGFAYGQVKEDIASVLKAPTLGGSTFTFGTCTGPVGPAGGAPCGAGASSPGPTGWAAGGGAEYALFRNVSIKAEYLYVKLGGDSFGVILKNGFGSYTASTNGVDLHTVRIGANWHFGGPVD
jgi:outer membrane immunogenic protein